MNKNILIKINLLINVFLKYISNIHFFCIILKIFRINLIIIRVKVIKFQDFFKLLFF